MRSVPVAVTGSVLTGVGSVFFAVLISSALLADRIPHPTPLFVGFTGAAITLPVGIPLMVYGLGDDE